MQGISGGNDWGGLIRGMQLTEGVVLADEIVLGVRTVIEGSRTT